MFIVIILIFARCNVFYPLFVSQIPIDCFLESFLEGQRRSPAQLALQLRRIDGIAEVVSGTVGYESDELLALALRTPEFSVHNIAQKPDEVDVFPLVVAADIVCVAIFTSVEYYIDSGCVVFDKEPVAYVFAFAVDRYRFVVFLLFLFGD